jgi:hypothetical protein
MFDKFKKVFNKQYDKKVINPFANGEIQRKLRQFRTGSLAAIERKSDLTSEDCDQSRRIRTGEALQKSIHEFIRDCKFVTIDDEIIELNSKIRSHFGRDAELDDIFKRDNSNFGLEFKINLNLDSEKSKTVIERVDHTQMLLNEVPTFGQSALISLIDPTANNIGKSVMSKYESIKSCVYGYQEFFNLFNINFSQKKWERMLLESRERAKEEFYYYEKIYTNLGGRK